MVSGCCQCEFGGCKGWFVRSFSVVGCRWVSLRSVLSCRWPAAASCLGRGRQRPRPPPIVWRQLREHSRSDVLAAKVRGATMAAGASRQQADVDWLAKIDAGLGPTVAMDSLEVQNLEPSAAAGDRCVRQYLVACKLFRTTADLHAVCFCVGTPSSLQIC